MISFHVPKRFFRTLIVLCLIALILSAQAGSIGAERVETSASVSGNGAVSGTSTISAGNTIVRGVSVTGSVSTGSDPASFSFSDSGHNFGSDDFTTVGYGASRVSVSGSIRGSGSASANASIYAKGEEDSLPDPNTIGLTTSLLADTLTTTDTAGSRATAAASASGFAKGSGDWKNVGTIRSSAEGSVSASSNARSTTGPSSSFSTAMIGSAASLDSDGTSDVDAYIMGVTGAKGENAYATATANGNAYATSEGVNIQSAQVSGRATGTSSARNGGSASTDAMLVAGSDSLGSTSMIYGTAGSDSSSEAFSGSFTASASGSAMTKGQDMPGGYATFSLSKGTATATGSQTGSGQIMADSFIIGTVDHPEQGFAWDFDITPSGYIPDAGLYLHDLDADLSVKSTLMNSILIGGSSPAFRGSASTSVNGNAISKAEKKNELLSVECEGSARASGSVRSPGMASGESGFESILFRNVQSGTAGAYLETDSVSVPITGSIDGSIAGASLLSEQFSAQGVQASSSGSVKGSARSSGSGTNVTTYSTSEGTLSGSVSTTNSAGANTAGLLGSVHAAGLEGPGFENSLFDASVLVSESNAADVIDTTGSATGTVTGKTKASSEQFEKMVQKYSSGTAVDGQAKTTVRAQKGTGLAIAGLGSVSLVQPVGDPATPDAFVRNAEGGVSYAIARGEDPTARVTSSSEIQGTGSSEGSVKFYASGYDPFTLTANGKVTLTKATAVTDARTKNESEAIAFGLTAQQASLTGTNGVSEGVAGFGTCTAASDNATVKADAKIDRIDLSNVARVDTPGGAITPTNISVTFMNGVSTSKLDPLKNLGNTTVTTSPFAITFNPDPDAGGTAAGTLIKSVKVVTDDNPNVANGYIEGLAGSAGLPPALDLNLAPLLFGVHP